MPAAADSASYGGLQRNPFGASPQDFPSEQPDHPLTATNGWSGQATDLPNGSIRGLEPSIIDEATLHDLAEIDRTMEMLQSLRSSILERQTIDQETISNLGIQRTQLHRRLSQSPENRQQRTTVNDEGGHGFGVDLFLNASNAPFLFDLTEIGFDSSLPSTYPDATHPDPEGMISSGHTHQVPPVSEGVMQLTSSRKDTPRIAGISEAWPTESRKRHRSVTSVVDPMESNLLLPPGSEPTPLSSDAQLQTAKKKKMNACLCCRLGKKGCSGDSVCETCQDETQCVRPTWLDTTVFDHGEIGFLAFAASS
jgi:hypothetical protein